MFKHNRLATTAQSAFVFTIVAMLCATAPAQKGRSSTTGAPLKGVDVKLGKNPGGSPAARTTSDKGEFNFGVAPAGKYDLIVSPPPGLADTQAGAAGDQRTINLNSSKSNIYRLAIDGVKGGPITKDLNFKEKALGGPDTSTRVGKPKFQDITVTIETDGKAEVKGTTTARAVNNPGVK